LEYFLILTDKIPRLVFKKRTDFKTGVCSCFYWIKAQQSSFYFLCSFNQCKTYICYVVLGYRQQNTAGSSNKVNLNRQYWATQYQSVRTM